MILRPRWAWLVLTLVLSTLNSWFLPVSLEAQTQGQGMASITLPPPDTVAGMPLMKALARRQTARAFSPDTLPTRILSDLLWAGFGVNRPESGKRTAPSAVNWQETDIYVVMEEGSYRYVPGRHELDPVQAGDLRSLTGTQAFVRDAPVTLVFVADRSRITGRSEEEKDFYSAIDVGFISQNVYLYCASAGLATGVRALIDRPPLAEALGLRDDQRIIVAQTVGFPGE
jgi:SagB-type dehydrogenase family enzyme